MSKNLHHFKQVALLLFACKTNLQKLPSWFKRRISAYRASFKQRPKGEIFKIHLAHLVHPVQSNYLVSQLVVVTPVPLVLIIKLIVGVKMMVVNSEIIPTVHFFPLRSLSSRVLFLMVLP